MDYFNHMDTPIRGWEEPYSQDTGIPRHYSNSWENMYHTQDYYEIEKELVHIPWRFDELENRGAYVVYTTNEDEWQPTHYLNHFSICLPL